MSIKALMDDTAPPNESWDDNYFTAASAGRGRDLSGHSGLIDI